MDPVPFQSEKDQAAAWFRTLRDRIVAAFEGLEASHDTGPFADRPPGQFEVTQTSRAAAMARSRSARRPASRARSSEASMATGSSRRVTTGFWQG